MSPLPHQCTAPTSFYTTTFLWSLLWHINAFPLCSPSSLVPSTSPIQPFDISSVATATLPLQSVLLPPFSALFLLDTQPVSCQAAGLISCLFWRRGQLVQGDQLLGRCQLWALGTAWHAESGYTSGDQVRAPTYTCTEYTQHTRSHQCCHLPSTTMGHKVMWCKMINELV